MREEKADFKIYRLGRYASGCYFDSGYLHINQTKEERYRAEGTPPVSTLTYTMRGGLCPFR